MPRGVYDRSKVKNKKASSVDEIVSKNEAPKVKRKYTKRAKADEVQSPEVPQMKHEGIGHAVGYNHDARFQFEFLTQQLAQLTTIKREAGGTSGEFDNIIKKVIAQMSKTFEQLHPTEQPKPIEKVAAPKPVVEVKTNGKTESIEEKPEKTALPAPVPFLGTAPSQA